MARVGLRDLDADNIGDKLSGSEIASKIGAVVNVAEKDFSSDCSIVETAFSFSGEAIVRHVRGLVLGIGLGLELRRLWECRLRVWYVTGWLGLCNHEIIWISPLNGAMRSELFRE